MVAEDVVGRDPLADRVLLHTLHFVVGRGAVVAAHDELGRGAGLVKGDAVVQTILQNGRRRAVRIHQRSQNDYRIGLRFGRLLGGDDALGRNP